MSSHTDMEIFAQVIAAGSMSAAGRQLNLSPALISKRIQRLEEHLGTRLLQRTTRQISLTEAGQGYYERLIDILAAIEDAENFVARRSSIARGTLRISAPTSFGRKHIAPHLAEFMEANDELTIHLELTDELVDIVGDGFDVAIRIAQLSDSSLVAKKLAPVQRVLCAAPSYLRRAGWPKTPADLEAHECLSLTTQKVWHLEGPDGMHSIQSTGSLITNSNDVVRTCLLNGQGIALRSTWDVAEHLSDGDLEVVLPEYHAPQEVAIYALYPSRQFLPYKVRAFIDYFANLYSGQFYWQGGSQSIVAAE